jgi:hypothetical protein
VSLVWWHLCGRFYAVRARRAAASAGRFHAISEEFFRLIGEQR